MHRSRATISGPHPGGLSAADVLGRLPADAGKVLVGCDGRVSSRLLARELTGAAPGGPTPFAAFAAAVAAGEAAAGVYLGGAHMPQEYAGAALLDADGLPADWSPDAAETAAAREFGEPEAGFAPYLDGLRSRLDLARIALIPRSFVFDMMFGPCAAPLEALLGPLPGRVKLLTAREYEPEARETITPDPFRANARDLAARIAKNTAETGFMLGGDGRRLRVLSNNGEALEADAVAALLLFERAHFRGETGLLLRHAAAPRGVDAVAARLGIEVEEHFGGETGFARRTAGGGFVLGILPGGEFCFPGPTPAPDGLQAALALIELNSRTDLPPHLTLREHLAEYAPRGYRSAALPLAPGADSAALLGGAAEALERAGLNRLEVSQELAAFAGEDGESRLTLRPALDGGALELFADAADDAAARALAGRARNLLVRRVL